MKTTTKKRLQKLLTGVLVFAVGLLIANHVVFLHSHKLPDGSIIIHAHPYNKSQDSAPFKKHQHTSSELFHISNIQLLFFASIFSVLAIPVVAQTTNYFYRTSSIHRHCFFRLKGREPPFSCYQTPQ